MAILSKLDIVSLGFKMKLYSQRSVLNKQTNLQHAVYKKLRNEKKKQIHGKREKTAQYTFKGVGVSRTFEGVGVSRYCLN